MSTPATLAPVVQAGRKDLFLLVARALASKDAQSPGDRFAYLVAGLAPTDDEWLRKLIDWMGQHPSLRRLRLAAVAELVRARLVLGGNRQVVDDALLRADEPGELLAYWFERYGRSIPKPIKHGIADAVRRLYDEAAIATYDGPSAAMRFADVLHLTHPAPANALQSKVFEHAVLYRRPRARTMSQSLPLLRARSALYSIPGHRRRQLLERPDATEILATAGMTWQMVQRWLPSEMFGKSWAAVLPSMSYQDTLANLGEFDRAGLDSETADLVASELAEPRAVFRARAMPLEIMAVYRAMRGSRWSEALRQALDLSLAHVPTLPDRTLILVDRTEAMGEPMPKGSALTRADAAAVFGAALALRSASADLVAFGTTSGRIRLSPSEPLIDVVDRFQPVGGAETAAQAVRARFADHQRVVVLTHRDAAIDAAEAVVVPGHEHIITGINDGWFTAIPLIEMARLGRWPF